MKAQSIGDVDHFAVSLLIIWGTMAEKKSS